MKKGKIEKKNFILTENHRHLPIASVNDPFSGSASKDGSILTAKGSLAIHPRVRANQALVGLRRFREITKDFLFFCILKRTTPLHTVERFWLTNILSAELSLCVSHPTLGKDRLYKPEVPIIQGHINSLSPWTANRVENSSPCQTKSLRPKSSAVLEYHKCR